MTGIDAQLSVLTSWPSPESADYRALPVGYDGHDLAVARCSCASVWDEGREGSRQQFFSLA
jgi:hypothetical protein